LRETFKRLAETTPYPIDTTIEGFLLLIGNDNHRHSRSVIRELQRALWKLTRQGCTGLTGRLAPECTGSPAQLSRPHWPSPGSYRHAQRDFLIRSGRTAPRGQTRSESNLHHRLQLQSQRHGHENLEKVHEFCENSAPRVNSSGPSKSPSRPIVSGGRVTRCRMPNVWDRRSQRRP